MIDLCKSGAFRIDLYHRINTFEVNIPPLRERKEDILYLLEHFRQEYGVPAFSQEACQALLEYEWPGNVREIQNLAKRLSALKKERKEICLEDLPENVVLSFQQLVSENTSKGRPATSAALKQKLIENAFLQAGGNKSKAARLLNISRATLYNKLRKYGMTAHRRNRSN